MIEATAAFGGFWYQHGMARTKLLAVSLFLLSTLTTCHGYRLSFPTYSFREHPIYRHKQFRDRKFRPAPVVMRRYIKSNLVGLNDTENMMFSVGKAEYLNIVDGKPLGDPLDVLYTPYAFAQKRKTYLEVNLNRYARVFLAMVNGVTMNDDIANPKIVTGLGGNWKNLRSIQTKDGEPITIGSRSRGISYQLPGRAYVVESLFRVNDAIHLPTPRLLKVDGKEITQYYLFFAKAGMPHRPAVAFEYPETPRYVTDLATGKRITIRKPVVPNEQCPRWLHDLYRTRSRDLQVGKRYRELPYWRTWHPIIDPVFYCYFDHEHGSYPGKYRPLFDYTAWKTPDNSTPHRRQNESDQGFKVYALPLHDQKKYVIMTVHMQCSKARRFHARHHTMIFAVLDEKWKLQMEFHMKMDFGFGALVTKNFKTVALNQEQEHVKKEIGFAIQRFRRFNVLDLDNYPKNIDRNYRMRSGAKPTMKNKDLISHGIYERWNAPLNNCHSRKGGLLDAFLFDIRNAATGKKRASDPDSAPMTKLKGNSLDRTFFIGSSDVIVGPQYCQFQGERRPRVVFYTDPYFEKSYKYPGKYRARQFIRPGSENVVFKSGEYTAVDPWAGYYEMTPSHRVHRRGHCNVEGAVKADIN